MDRYSRKLPYHHDEEIEIEQVRSGDHAKPKHRRTLYSLGLKGVGDTSIIKFDDAKAGELHSVGHLVKVLTAPSRRPHPTKPRRVRAEKTKEVDSRKEEVKAVTVTTYISSGGDSQILGVKGGGLFRIEIQEGGFALMWPSPLSFNDFLAMARELWWPEDDGRVSIFPNEGEPILDQPVSSLSESDGTGESPGFVRIDFKDRSLTWADDYEDPDRVPDADPFRPSGVHEVSVAGTNFDRENIAKLLRKTATEPLAELSKQLMASAAETLEQ
ncbi:MAG: 50S ribosomal protein L30 [Actinobacteria bacterium]|nr:50S ribosomal protein L30 [Actinomycetota bacterium]